MIIIIIHLPLSVFFIYCIFFIVFICVYSLGEVKYIYDCDIFL